jgi:ADP-ribose pyrophosphatase
MDEKIHLYLARGISFTERELDEDEFLNVELVPLETLYGMVMSGEIADAKTQIAILKAKAVINEGKI